MALALEIKNLRKVYPGDFVAVDNVSLEVAEGDFYALLGPNGAGKSTTIGILSSLVNKTSGSIRVLGYDLEKQRDKAKAQIGLVPQEFNFNVFESVLEVVANQGGYYGLRRREAVAQATRLLQKLDLWQKRSVPAGRLSGGMKRRLMIARALVHSPKILLLDEPTTGVDIELRRSTWAFLKSLNNSGTTIILTTHYLEEAEYLCRHIGIINEGKMLMDMAMRDFMQCLDQQTLTLTLQAPIATVPALSVGTAILIDPMTLEITVPTTLTMNQLLQELTAANIEVVSLRHQSGRLEELFLHVVTRNQTKQKTL